MKLVTSEQKYQKYVMKPIFKDGYPFSKHLFVIFDTIFCISWRFITPFRIEGDTEIKFYPSKFTIFW